MAPTRSSQIRFVPALLHCLLGFVIVMQMLGTPTSLWTLEFESNTAETTPQEEFSLSASQVTLVPVLTALRYFESSTRIPSVLLEETLFRPPDFRYPPLSPI